MEEMRAAWAMKIVGVCHTAGSTGHVAWRKTDGSGDRYRRFSMTNEVEDEESRDSGTDNNQSHGGGSNPCLTLAATDVNAFLHQAATRTGLYPLGGASAHIADALGEAWVGPGAQAISKSGLGFLVKVSTDGLRQYRSPVFKPKRQVTQANYDRRERPKGSWSDRGHVDIDPTCP
jgi:hypothetical protein